mmetsp:Transcript_14400/g.23581  ORF Transcript_14400/g.23581 Transcript_14400/m.23581 type:complete len:252 (+) Transcript_14400:837-1592(+)
MIPREVADVFFISFSIFLFEIVIAAVGTTFVCTIVAIFVGAMAILLFLRMFMAIFSRVIPSMAFDTMTRMALSVLVHVVVRQIIADPFCDIALELVLVGSHNSSSSFGAFFFFNLGFPGLLALMSVSVICKLFLAIPAARAIKNSPIYDHLVERRLCVILLKPFWCNVVDGVLAFEPSSLYHMRWRSFDRHFFYPFHIWHRNNAFCCKLRIYCFLDSRIKRCLIGECLSFCDPFCDSLRKCLTKALGYVIL